MILAVQAATESPFSATVDTMLGYDLRSDLVHGTPTTDVLDAEAFSFAERRRRRAFKVLCDYLELASKIEAQTVSDLVTHLDDGICLELARGSMNEEHHESSQSTRAHFTPMRPCRHPRSSEIDVGKNVSATGSNLEGLRADDAEPVQLPDIARAWVDAVGVGDRIELGVDAEVARRAQGRNLSTAAGKGGGSDDGGGGGHDDLHAGDGALRTRWGPPDADGSRPRRFDDGPDPSLPVTWRDTCPSSHCCGRRGSGWPRPTTVIRPRHADPRRPTWAVVCASGRRRSNWVQGTGW